MRTANHLKNKKSYDKNLSMQKLSDIEKSIELPIANKSTTMNGWTDNKNEKDLEEKILWNRIPNRDSKITRSFPNLNLNINQVQEMNECANKLNDYISITNLNAESSPKNKKSFYNKISNSIKIINTTCTKLETIDIPRVPN